MQLRTEVFISVRPIGLMDKSSCRNRNETFLIRLAIRLIDGMMRCIKTKSK